MIRAIIVLIGCIYAVLALSLVPPTLYALFAILASGFDPVVAMYMSFLCVNVVLCGLIAYAFLARRSWGRILVVCYNGFWLLVVLCGQVALVVSGRAVWLRDAPLAGHVTAIAVTGVLVGVIALSCQGNVRALMGGRVP